MFAFTLVILSDGLENLVEISTDTRLVVDTDAFGGG